MFKGLLNNKFLRDMGTANGIVLLYLAIMQVGAWWIVFATPPLPEGVSTNKEMLSFIMSEDSGLQDLFYMSCIVFCVSLLSSLTYFFGKSRTLFTWIFFLLIAQAALWVAVMGWEKGPYLLIPVGIGVFPILFAKEKP